MKMLVLLLLFFLLSSGRLLPAFTTRPAQSGESTIRISKPEIVSGSRFLAFHDLSAWAHESDSADPGRLILTSDEIDAGLDWDELVVSWNAALPSEGGLRIEARGIYPDHTTKYYLLGLWSPVASKAFDKTAPPSLMPRESLKGQKDTDGDVQTDTLTLKRSGAKLQLRLTLSGTNSTQTALKYIACSFLNSHLTFTPLEPNRTAWGKVLEVPERAQGNYEHGSVICSPTSLSMTLAHWARVLHRPELDKDVPEVVEGVYDRIYDGTGNWPFNTAYAGSFPGLRAGVSRFRDIRELEDWITKGIPVICSVSYNLLRGKDNAGDSGHLVVCVGFTKDGDIILNDPALNPKRGLRVRTPYPRGNFLRGWAYSHNTVYLVYPESYDLPKDRFGHWDSVEALKTRK